MNSNNSDAASRFETVAIPPWRLTPRTKPHSHRDSFSELHQSFLVDPTHISPFSYPAAPPSRHRKHKKQALSNSDCIMEAELSPVAVQSLTMGWSFRMQLQEIDKQHTMDDSEEEEEEKEHRDHRRTKAPASSAGTSETSWVSHPPTTGTHSRASSYKGGQSCRLISRPRHNTDKAPQKNHAEHSCTHAQPAARLAHASRVESPTMDPSTSIHRRRSDPPSPKEMLSSSSRRSPASSSLPSRPSIHSISKPDRPGVESQRLER